MAKKLLGLGIKVLIILILNISKTENTVYSYAARNRMLKINSIDFIDQDSIWGNLTII